MPAKNTPGPSAHIAQRIGRCRRQMKKNKISAFLVTNRRDGIYLAGFTGEDSALLITPRDVHIISDRRFEESIKKECPWATVWMRRGMLPAEIAKTCATLKLRTVAVQPNTMSLADHDAIKEKNKRTRLVHAPPILSGMRCIKDSQDLTRIRKAIRVAEEAYLVMRETIRVGQTEQEMTARLEFEMQKRGATGASFPTICAVGSNAALPHAEPGKRKVLPGSAILFDWGARLDYYCSDLTRMVFVGSIPPRIGELYKIVLEAQRRAIAAIRPGRRMCDIDKIARTYITEAGYGEEFGHGLGHGLGLDVHEGPSLSWRSDEKLKAGMLVTVEPGIYLPRIGGVRIEDDLIVTAKGCRVLSRLDKELETAVIRCRR